MIRLTRIVLAVFLLSLQPFIAESPGAPQVVQEPESGIYYEVTHVSGSTYDVELWEHPGAFGDPCFCFTEFTIKRSAANPTE